MIFNLIKNKVENSILESVSVLWVPSPRCHALIHVGSPNICSFEQRSIVERRLMLFIVKSVSLTLDGRNFEGEAQVLGTLGAIHNTTVERRSWAWWSFLQEWKFADRTGWGSTRSREIGQFVRVGFLLLLDISIKLHDLCFQLWLVFHQLTETTQYIVAETQNVGLFCVLVSSRL